MTIPADIEAGLDTEISNKDIIKFIKNVLIDKVTHDEFDKLKILINLTDLQIEVCISDEIYNICKIYIYIKIKDNYLNFTTTKL